MEERQNYNLMGEVYRFGEEALRGYRHTVNPLARQINTRLWRMLPKLEKEDAELLEKLVGVAKR